MKPGKAISTMLLNRLLSRSLRLWPYGPDYTSKRWMIWMSSWISSSSWFSSAERIISSILTKSSIRSVKKVSADLPWYTGSWNYICFFCCSTIVFNLILSLVKFSASITFSSSYSMYFLRRLRLLAADMRFLARRYSCLVFESLFERRPRFLFSPVTVSTDDY